MISGGGLRQRPSGKTFSDCSGLVGMGNLETIGFGGSCHWCTEAVFQSVRGVAKVEQGWIAPQVIDKFSEAVLVHFDPAKVSLAVLVAVHLHSHSSTSRHSMREKYRSAVYVFSCVQGDQVMRAFKSLRHEFDGQLVTQILAFGSLRLNGSELLDYYATDPERPFCRNYIKPKLKMLLERFGPGVFSPVKKINH